MVQNVDLNVLEQSLNESRLAVLYGPSGIGKSSNATQFVYMTEKKYKCVWLNADGKDKLKRSLKNWHDLNSSNNNNNTKNEETFKYFVR